MDLIYVNYSVIEGGVVGKKNVQVGGECNISAQNTPKAFVLVLAVSQKVGEI